MSEMLLKVDNLVKKYDNFSLKNVCLGLPKGYIMGFIGQNGAGKSTTIKAIMNLIDFDGGRIEIFGLDNRKYCNEIRNRIGYVSEEQYFYDDMTVEWTGNFIGSFYSKWDDGYFRKLMGQFNLDGKKKIKELSKGMKVKLSLALALGHRPELLILDEPTSGLDPVVRSELLEIFLDIIQDDSCSIFFSSHITTDIEKVADFVTIIDNGRIVLSEEKDTLLNNWKVVKADNSCFNTEISEKLIGIKKGDFGYSGVTGRFDDFMNVFRKYFPGASFKSEKVTLDELLVRIAKEGDASC